MVSDDVRITSSLRSDVIKTKFSIFLSPLDGSCQKLRNYVYIVEVMQRKLWSLFSGHGVHSLVTSKTSSITICDRWATKSLLSSKFFSRYLYYIDLHTHLEIRTYMKF